jgi:hypothetical protein
MPVEDITVILEKHMEKPKICLIRTSLPYWMVESEILFGSVSAPDLLWIAKFKTGSQLQRSLIRLRLLASLEDVSRRRAISNIGLLNKVYNEREWLTCVKFHMY